MSRTGLTPKRFTSHVLLAAAVLLVVLAVSPGVGTQPIGVIDAWRAILGGDRDSQAYLIAFDLRLPRALIAATAGLTLALCGAVFQTLFRNVLATPYTLGVASGGSLGAVIGIKLGLTTIFLGMPPVSWCALAGALGVVLLLFVLAGATCRISGNALVLAGVTIGLFCGSMIMFVTYIADVRELFFAVRWTMGNLEAHGYRSLGGVIVPLIVCWTVLISRARPLNQFELGEELAASRGVHPVGLQIVCILFASVAVACVISICGPIGFVGLIVPHLVRLIVGRDHRLLLPTAAVWGGTFLVVCDWLAQRIPVWYGQWTGQEFTGASLPIGVMTSLLGGPAFIVLLVRNRRRLGG